MQTGGDPEKTETFKDIVKAKETLTDPAKYEAYQKYGNPDGPGVSVAVRQRGQWGFWGYIVGLRDGARKLWR